MSDTKKRVGPPAQIDFSRYRPIEVKVEGSSRDDFEKAFKAFNRAFQNARVIGELKEKRFYKKPSEKKRHKRREARDARLKAEARERMMKTGEWDRRQKKRAQKQINKEERNSEVFE